MDYGNTKTPSMQRRFGSATLSQLDFPRGRQLEFPMGKIPLGQYSYKIVVVVVVVVVAVVVVVVVCLFVCLFVLGGGVVLILKK